MLSENELKSTLKSSLGINLSRAKFIVAFMTALFIVQTVKLTRISNSMDVKANKDSRYKRCQRFFKDFKFDFIMLSKFLFRLYPGDKENVILAIDRTNWKLGKIDINILMLSITYDGIAFPVMWKMLDNNGGSSNTNDRIQIIERFIGVFGKEIIKSILCDREFIGKDWVYYLKNVANINFRIRVKEKEIINKKNGQLAPLKNFFRSIGPGQEKILEGRRILWGHHVFIACVKSSLGELVIVITDDEAYSALSDYAIRWEIESLFKCFKKSGFNLEDTHLTHTERVNNLLGIVAIGFTWAYLSGELECEKQPIMIKSHGRKEKSVFKVGLDHLHRILLYRLKYISEYQEIINILCNKSIGPEYLHSKKLDIPHNLSCKA